MFVKLCPWRFHTVLYYPAKWLPDMETAEVSHLWETLSTPSAFHNSVLLQRWCVNLTMDGCEGAGGVQASVISVSGNKESKQNRDRTITRTAARPGEDGLLLVFAVGPCSSGPGPRSSSSSLRLPRGQVCVGSVSSHYTQTMLTENEVAAYEPSTEVCQSL